MTASDTENLQSSLDTAPSVGAEQTFVSSQSPDKPADVNAVSRIFWHIDANESTWHHSLERLKKTLQQHPHIVKPLNIVMAIELIDRPKNAFQSLRAMVVLDTLTSLSDENRKEAANTLLARMNSLSALIKASLQKSPELDSYQTRWDTLASIYERVYTPRTIDMAYLKRLQKTDAEKGVFSIAFHVASVVNPEDSETRDFALASLLDQIQKRPAYRDAVLALVEQSVVSGYDDEAKRAWELAARITGKEPSFYINEFLQKDRKERSRAWARYMFTVPSTPKPVTQVPAAEGWKKVREQILSTSLSKAWKQSPTRKVLHTVSSMMGLSQN